jgi:hypothetical protein
MSLNLLSFKIQPRLQISNYSRSTKSKMVTLATPEADT